MLDDEGRVHLPSPAHRHVELLGGHLLVDEHDPPVDRRALRLVDGERVAEGDVIEGDPKSEAGRRTVSLPQLLVAELRVHLLQYAQTGVNGYVFVGPTGQPLERSNFRGRIWVPAIELMGLSGVRFHDLRHTAGTLAARTGATTKELMARFGHSSPRASMIYQHAAADRDRLIAERLDAMTVEAGLAPIVPIEEGKTGRKTTVLGA